MALFEYQALSKDGKRVRGSLDAASESAVRQSLTKQGMYPISVQASRSGTSQSFFGQLFRRSVSDKEKILFTKQLAVLIKSGVPLLQALELLADQFEGQLHTVLISIKDGVKQGQSLADGLEQYPKIFDTTYVQLVRAGEATGKLQTILERLVNYLERGQEVSKRIKSAMTYPIIQLTFVSLIVIVLLYFVVPTLTATFAAQKKELPTATKILVAASNFVINYYLFLIVAIILLILGYSSWAATNNGRITIDRIKLKLPIVGYFTRMGSIVQFSQTLGMLMESGVNLSDALDIVVKIVDNQVLKNALSVARDKIIKEGKISEYLKETGIFPPIAIYLLKTGEQSGQLDTMLLNVAQTYEADIKEYADGLTTLLEPIMLLIMALVVGFIVIAIALPLMKMGEI